MAEAKQVIESMLAEADIQVNGTRPWDIQVHDERLHRRILGQGTLGVGESYMDGWWDCDALDEMVARAASAGIKDTFKLTPAAVVTIGRAMVLNLASKARAFEIGEKHYDIGNDLYKRMLDDRLTYTCGYWKDADNLHTAQEAKLDLACRKIGLKKGDRVLDIGCGWGSFAGYAAEKYGAEVVGVTVSKEQVAYARERYGHLPVEFRLQDYRDVTGTFDHIVSFGMFEHVGVKNYDTFMAVAERNLKDKGFFLLHTIGSNKSVRATDPWLEKYIFPNSMLPSAKQIAAVTEKRFVIEDWHNFGPDYDTTLLAWYENAEAAWGELGERYTERFRRMWRFYLLSCAGMFRARKIQLWQIVFTKHGARGRYDAAR